MPSISVLKKESGLSSAQTSGKTFSVDDYFFRSLAEDLKRTKSPLIARQFSVDEKQALSATPPEVTPSPLPIAPEPEKEIEIQPAKPKVIVQEKKQREALAKIEVEKTKKITAINQRKAKELYKQGKAYYKKDQFERAIQFLQESLQLNPNIQKATKYFIKSQKKFNKLQKQKQEKLEKIQKQTLQQTTKEVRQQTQAQLTQELELARRQAEQEVQIQIQQLQQTIQSLKQQREAIMAQQAQEEKTFKEAQEEKTRIEARLQAEQEAQEEIKQQKQQQISQIQQEAEQKLAPQLESLKQQLAGQQKLLKQAQAQKQTIEEQSQQIQALTQEKQTQLQKLQSQDLAPLQPSEPAMIEPKPITDEDLSEILTAPLEPTPETPKAPSQIFTPPIIPSPITPSVQPDVKTPTPMIEPSISSIPAPLPTVPTEADSIYTHAQILTSPARKIFSLKKIFIGLSTLVGLSLFSFFAYWLLALRPTPTPTPTLPKKEAALIVRFNKPQENSSSWSKLLKTVIPRVLSLSLENYQIDPVTDFDPLIKQEFFYLDFSAFNLNNLSGILIVSLQDKAEAETLLEKIKGRQKDQTFLENYHQYDIIKCQNQYWVFVDLFNLHYLLFSQNLENLKLTLDYFQKQELNFIEDLEDKVNLAPLPTGTTINTWTNDKNLQISIKQILAQIDLKLPWPVSENLNDYFTIALLDGPQNQPDQIRTAAIFSFNDFDQINQAMLNWEKTISHETGFLFWGLKPTMPTTLNFQGIIYKNMVIRFLKMPNADLGIYYGLSKKHLVLTNSQRNATMILDQLNP